MDKLLEAMRAFLLAFNAHPNRQEALTAFHKEGQSLAQHFIDMGHGIETEASKTTIAQANRDRDTAKADLVKAQETIATLSKDKPDVAAMEQKHATALQDLQTKFDTDKAALKAAIRKGYLDRDVEKLKGKLKDKKVNDAIATVLLQDQDLLDRISHDEKGATTVKQAGTRTPYTVATGQDALDPVVEAELLKKVPPRGFDEEIDSGSESSGHGNQGGGTGDKSKRKNIFDNIRKKGEDRVKEKAGTALSDVRNKKFRGTTPAR